MDSTSNARASSSQLHSLSPPSSPQSCTETRLAHNVTSISRQLLDSFAFAQVDNLVEDLAHMRQYLVSKLPEAGTQPLRLDKSNNAHNSQSSAEFEKTLIPEYKGVLYGRRCLATQKTILEYLTGRCLQQLQTCLLELERTESASARVEASADYVMRAGQDHGTWIDAEGLDAESRRLYQEVRNDLYELGEEMLNLDGARKVTEDFRKDPISFLRAVR